jgi:ComF family protein
MALLDLIFPKRCVSCRKIGRYICNNCRYKIEYIRHQICPVCGLNAIDGITHPRCMTRYSLDGIYSFFRYKSVIQKAIKTIKYRFVYDLAENLIGLVQNADLDFLRNQIGKNSVMVPIPLHSERMKTRGFNQAEILGKILARRFGVSIDSDALKRVKKTVPQAEVKDRKKRLINMQDVFAVGKISDNHLYSKIILFDDVYTTGATLRSAANVLKRAGVDSVFGMTIAHG